MSRCHTTDGNYTCLPAQGILGNERKYMAAQCVRPVDVDYLTKTTKRSLKKNLDGPIRQSSTG